MKILIVKKGALGDVVRTSYFAGSLRRKHGHSLRLCWYTSKEALPLLAHNPHIDKASDDVGSFVQEDFDIVYSLDDEKEILTEVSFLRCQRLIGAYIDPLGKPDYSKEAAEWFDMGLLSRFGKERADQLKRANTRTHAEIFSRIFSVDFVHPEFFGGTESSAATGYVRALGAPVIGINPFAGGRWKSKQLMTSELEKLLRALLQQGDLCKHIVLLGRGDDYQANRQMAELVGDSRVSVPCTDGSILDLAGTINGLDLLITSDSLALHLAVAQKIPIVAFFAPTSAAEIDTFGNGFKVMSTSSDYCSYNPNADNSSITFGRLLDGFVAMRTRPNAAFTA